MRRLAMISATLVMLGIMILLLSGCGATEVYTTAKTTNDVTFKGALMRVCSPIADLAAQRKLSYEAQNARIVLCAEISSVQPNSI